jgi:membrane dipeptidase
MIVWDAHLDLAFNALNANRNLLDPVSLIRARETSLENTVPTGWGRAQGTVAFPQMYQGRVAVSFATLLAGVDAEPRAHVDYETAFQAHGVALGQMAYYQALEKEGYVRILTELSALDAHIAQWEAWDEDEAAKPEDAPPLGFIIDIEGADPILNPVELQEWWDLGLRVIMLGHFGPGRYTGGTGTDLPLNDMGVELLKEAQRLGMVFDITHLSDQAFWQSLELFEGPVIASHSNARVLVPGQRQLSDAQLQAIIQRKGVIGISADVWMLDPDWVAGVGTNENVTLATMVDHIDYMCQLAGDSLHAGIGTDLDGGFGYLQSPNDLDTIADLQKISGLLAGRGYSETDIANIMYRNFLTVMHEAWK